MEKNSDIDLKSWVDGHLEPLNAPIEWQPDVEHGLALLRQSGQTSRMRARRRIWVSGASVAVLLCLLAFPVTRVFASRCLGACVAGGNQFGILLRTVFSPSGSPGASLSAMTGSAVPDFTSVDDSGVPLSLSDLKGKVIVLNFWATWCPPCAQETPWFVELQQKYRDAGLVVVGVSMDDDGWAAVRPFISRMGVNYRMILGDRQISRLFGGVESLPETVIIDRSGRMTWTAVGLITRDGLESNIKAMLKLSEGDHVE